MLITQKLVHRCKSWDMKNVNCNFLDSLDKIQKIFLLQDFPLYVLCRYAEKVVPTMQMLFAINKKLCC